MTSLSSLPFTQSPLYIFAHQFFYILTGLFQTLGAQWLYYQGAASGKAFTTSTAQYFGMACIGLFLPCMGRSTFGKNFEYVNLPTINDTKAEPPVFVPDQKSARSKHTPAPMNHRALIRLASLDVVANFLVTVGFFYVGSGMYQVIYSSVVIWCAILSYFFMGRKLAPTQWFAIFGTSAGLALSTLGNVGAGGDDVCDPLRYLSLRFVPLLLSFSFFPSSPSPFNPPLLFQPVSTF
ncbi:hypothetical protein BC938DRAFT_483289 [Jimgerdemannia flammicorona]|uniref:Uncharacterized protein n=1 Tax=Jimgerdemannia flammicorona TaxID=994334 RepID=A0A433QVS1_9FUNG|nr:hypothetical protein BC938DRAFT_483289 [Jimgerdemannia flammicorona]